jgi:hypothetical protein
MEVVLTGEALDVTSRIRTYAGIAHEIIVVVLMWTCMCMRACVCSLRGAVLHHGVRRRRGPPHAPRAHPGSAPPPGGAVQVESS